MCHLPWRATSGLCHALHINSILDEDNDDEDAAAAAAADDDDDEALLVTLESSGISENMFTNASSSVFITSLTPHNISTIGLMRRHYYTPTVAVRVRVVHKLCMGQR